MFYHLKKCTPNKLQAIFSSNWDYIVKIEKNIFDRPVKNNLRTYSNIRKIQAGPGDDYTTFCLLGNPYFKEYYRTIPTDLSKQETLVADPKAIR